MLDALSHSIWKRKEPQKRNGFLSANGIQSCHYRLRKMPKNALNSHFKLFKSQIFHYKKVTNSIYFLWPQLLHINLLFWARSLQSFSSSNFSLWHFSWSCFEIPEARHNPQPTPFLFPLFSSAGAAGSYLHFKPLGKSFFQVGKPQFFPSFNEWAYASLSYWSQLWIYHKRFPSFQNQFSIPSFHTYLLHFQVFDFSNSLQAVPLKGLLICI